MTVQRAPISTYRFKCSECGKVHDVRAVAPPGPPVGWRYRDTGLVCGGCLRDQAVIVDYKRGRGMLFK